MKLVEFELMKGYYPRKLLAGNRVFVELGRIPGWG
jgi:hypothetical protein